MKKVSVIIPCYKNANLTKACLESIRLYTHMPCELILIDDFSDDNGETQKVFEEFSSEKDIVVYNSINSGGCSRVWNQGLKLATNDYIMIMNNDMLVSENWLSKLLNTFDTSLNVKVVCPSLISHNKDGAHYVMRSEEGVNLFHKITRTLSIDHANEYMNASMGPCFMFHRELLREIGLFDETFGHGGFEDCDWFDRIIMKGYYLATRKDVWLYHHKYKGIINFSNLLEKQTVDYEYFSLKVKIRAEYLNNISDGEVKEMCKVIKEYKNESI